MLLPDLLHLPTIILLALVMGSGFTITFLPACIEYGFSGTHEHMLSAVGFAAMIATANFLSWFGFRSARRASATASFVGTSRGVWLFTIPIAYCIGLGFGIYLFIDQHA